MEFNFWLFLEEVSFSCFMRSLWESLFFHHSFLMAVDRVRPLRFASGDNNDGDEAIHAALAFYSSAETFGCRKKSLMDRRVYSKNEPWKKEIV